MSQKNVREFCDDVHLWLSRTFMPHLYQKTAILHTASRYNMCTEPSEDFFARIYLHFIKKDILEVFGDKKITILDIGCGQGRISLPLAQEGHRITGIDISSDAIKTAVTYASDQEVSIDFQMQDIVSEPEKFSDKSFDCVICTEMIYMVEQPEAVLRTFVRMVKPGGLVIVSFRPKMYYLLQAVLNHSWKDLDTISQTQGSRINGIWLNWFTRDEIMGLLTRVGISSKQMCSIGKFTGVAGDPQACFCNPAQLEESARGLLMDLEIRHAEYNVENGRYLYSSGIVIK